MTQLYENIVSLCKKHKLSIRKLEEKTGITQNTITNWKKHLPTADKVILLAVFLTYQ